MAAPDAATQIFGVSGGTHRREWFGVAAIGTRLERRDFCLDPAASRAELLFSRRDLLASAPCSPLCDLLLRYYCIGGTQYCGLTLPVGEAGDYRAALMGSSVPRSGRTTPDVGLSRCRSPTNSTASRRCMVREGSSWN